MNTIYGLLNTDDTGHQKTHSSSSCQNGLSSFDQRCI